MTAENESKLQERCKTTDNLEFHSLSLQLNSADLEINSNRTDVALRVGIVRETQKQTGLDSELSAILLKIEHSTFYLANTGVTDEEKLEKEVVLACMHYR
jgi:hypothetical protein